MSTFVTIDDPPAPDKDSHDEPRQESVVVAAAAQFSAPVP